MGLSLGQTVIVEWWGYLVRSHKRKESMRGQELVFEALSTLTRNSPTRSLGEAGIYHY